MCNINLSDLKGISLLGVDSDDNVYKININTTEPECTNSILGEDFKAGDLVEVRDGNKWIKAVYVCPSLIRGDHFCVFYEYPELRAGAYHVYTYPIGRIRKQEK